MYFHIRNDSGKVFYIGRGIKYRAWSKSGRNDHWTNIHKKHGITVKLIATGLTREEANYLERWFISLANEYDLTLSNKTSGGDGCHDLMFDDKSKIKMSRSQGGRVLCCSNGMRFDTGPKAAEWLSKNGHPHARQGHISACARGERGSAYGFSWWYDGDDEREYIPRYERLSRTAEKIVVRSDGMEFRNPECAARWIRENENPKATSGPIRNCAKGRQETAYKYIWRWKNE